MTAPIEGAAIVGGLAGNVLARLLGLVTFGHVRPLGSFTVLGAALAAAVELAWMIWLALWPLILAAAVLALAAVVGLIANTLSPRRYPPEIPPGWE